MSKRLLNLCLTALLSVVSTSAWALSQVDGVYQIGSAADLKAFAELVNSTEPYANAILTADIDKGTETYRIGRDGQDYQGVFDGNGHTITYDMTFTENGAGLFRNLGTHALVQNLKVQGTIKTNSSFAGGIAGWSSGRIRGCYVDVNIISTKTGDATDGGMIGIAYRGSVIENCLVKVDIDGENTTNCGGVAGWANEKINVVNCLVVSDGSAFNYADASNGHSSNIARNEGNLQVVNLSTYTADPYNNRPAGANYNNYVTQQWATCNATTVVPLDQLGDGKICYQLNNDQSKINWVQKIGTDPFPVPVAFGSTDDQVYASGATGCDGKADGLTYSNTPSNAVNTPHTFDKYGICTTCGCFNFDCFELDPTDNSVLLKTAEDLYLAEGWNRVGDGFKLNMKMENDITCIAPEGQQIFNSSNWVDGDFNGQGHTLTIGLSDMSITRCVGFIPEHTGKFENVILHGTIKTNADHVGSISGHGRQAIVRNVFSDVTINSEKTGDNTSGGLFGITYNASKVVENCIYAGTVNGVEGTTCIAGFSGWAGDATTYKNCAFLGALNNAGGDSHTISRNNGNAGCTNVYSVNEYNGTDAGKYIKTTAEDVESGKLAYELNENQNGLDRFYQKIGEDLMPMPFAKDGALVYCVAAEYRCDGQPLGDDVTYSNSATGSNIPDHTPVDGFCTVCGNLMEDYMTPVDGWYEIGNGKQLTWWSCYMNKYAEAKARLTADINMEGCMTRFTPIGTGAVKFVSEFDGQNHVISNFKYSGGDYSGLFGIIGGGAVIKNFVLDSSCSINGNAFCGIVGGTNGSGDVYLSNLGNEGPVTGTAQNVSGILGVDMGGAATLHISNCFVTGAIKGGSESATICSWSNGSSVVENCYSIASLEGKYGNEDSFTRGSAACNNCYEIEGVGTQNNKTGANKTNIITAAEVASGALCFKLNGQKDAIARFYQKIGTDAHPTTIAKDGTLVYAIYSSYRCDGVPTGDLTGFANAPAEITLPEHDFVDGACNICSAIETDGDGYAKIINTKTMVALATRVNVAGQTDIKARMYDDINMSGVAYTPAGAENKLFAGEFDGQGHVISNLVLDNSSTPYQGLFGRIGNGAVIKNFILDSTCSIKGSSFAGIVGGTNGSGDVYLSNLGNEGSVETVNENAAGIIGVDMGGSATLHISNCYVTGSVKGGRESATICGWSNGSSVIENCYSTASLEGFDKTFARGGAYLSNCYEINTVGTQTNTTKVTAEEVANGALAYKLRTAFGQAIGTDTHPVFDAPEVFFVGEAGYATLFDATTGYELNGDAKAYAATLNNTWLDLTEIGAGVPAGTPVILMGSYYNKQAKDLAAINIANDLKGTEADTAADGTMYILAKPEGEEVGFYLATGTIPAGKAYFQSASGVKAFYFSADDATGIENLNNQNTLNTPIYNLAGQRIQKMQKGINIVGGKKVLF